MLRHLSSPSYKILKALLNLHNETAGPSTGLFWKAASLSDCWDDWLNSYFIHKSFLWTVVQPRPQSWQRDWSDPTCGPDRGSDPLSHMVLREGVVRPHRGPTSHNLVKLSATFVTHVAHSLKSSTIFLISNTSIFHQKHFDIPVSSNILFMMIIAFLQLQDSYQVPENSTAFTNLLILLSHFRYLLCLTVLYSNLYLFA